RFGWTTRTLGDAAAGLRAGALPEKTLVLTFDDGYASVREEALPRLRARGFVATVFLVTDRCGGDSAWPGQTASLVRPLLTWDEAAALAEEGWELGAHGRTHRPLAGLTAAATEDEVLSSGEEISRR